MRVGAAALLAFLLFCQAAFAQDDTDPWLGCWTRIYDAAHLTKHPGQSVTAMTLAITSHSGEGGDYRAKVTAKLRDKTDSYANLDAALCSVAGDAKDRLACAGNGIFMDQFRLQPAAKNMKLAMQGDNEHIALMPGVDISAFVLLSPGNPENALFLLQPAPGKACGL
jgi:hypothetical protein